MKWSFVGVVSLLVVPAHAGIDWNWWFSKLNFTAPYGHVVEITEGHNNRPAHEAYINGFLAASADKRGELAAQHELYMACDLLADAVHKCMYDDFLAGHGHLLHPADRVLITNIQDVISHPDFAKGREARLITRIKERLEETTRYEKENIARIAHTPKIFVFCACLVAIGYGLYYKFGDKITQLAVQAEQEIEQEIEDVGHQLAHEITTT